MIAKNTSPPTGMQSQHDSVGGNYVAGGYHSSSNDALYLTATSRQNDCEGSQSYRSLTDEEGHDDHTISTSY